MTNLNTKEEVYFSDEPSKIEPYLKTYGTQIFGSRGEGHVHGVRLTYGSDYACTTEENYSLTIAVECHDWFTGQGEADVLRVQGETDCNPLIVVYHNAGCPDYFVSDYTFTNYWKPELMGGILAVMGIGSGCLGMKLFSLMASFSIAVFFALSSLWMISSFTMWMRNTVAFIIILSALVIVTIMLTLCLKKSKRFPVTLVLLGAIIGFQFGGLFYALIY